MDKFKLQLIEKLKNKGLSESSIKLYIRNIEKLNDDKPLKNLSFLKNKENILSKLDSYSENTKRNYLISISSVIQSTGKNKKLQEEYYSLVKKKNQDLSLKTPIAIKSEKQKENWLTQKEVLEILKKLNEKVNSFKNNNSLNEEQYETLLQYLVLSIFTLIPPRRNKDYQIMVIEDDWGEDLTKDLNYLDLKNKRFIYNNYKTKKNYGIIYQYLPKELLEIINIYLKFKKESVRDEFLVDYKGNALVKPMDLIKVFYKLFYPKKISSSLLRHIYLTSKYKDILKEMKEDSKAMSHSLNVAHNTYIVD
jgi:integrase